MNSEFESHVKQQTRFLKIMAVCSVLMLIIVGAAALFVCLRMQSLYTGVMASVRNLDDLIRELGKVDYQQLSKNLSELTEQSGDSLEAIAKLKQVDVDELNRAIKAFSDAVSPLAGLLGGLRR